MKVLSYLKAIASGFIWGLGQLFNKQFIKALFFFIFFVAFVGIELGTSNYFYEETETNELAYNNISGKDFGDTWYDRMPLQYFQLLENNSKDAHLIKNENFENYLEEIGIEIQEIAGIKNPINTHLFTEEAAIKFLAKEFVDVSPSSYTNLITKDQILTENFNLKDYSFIRTNETLYLNKTTNTFYRENNEKLEDGSNSRTYVESSLFTNDVINSPEILSSNSDLIRFKKDNEFYSLDNEFYLKVTETETEPNTDPIIRTRYVMLNSENNLVYYEGDTTKLNKETILGPIYLNEDSIYEYYEAGLVHNGRRLQYNSSTIMYTFRFLMSHTFNVPGNEYNTTDFERLMLRISFEINPEMQNEFIENYSNFFYNRGGMFLRGYWSVITLGTAKKQNYTSYMALSNNMIGTRSGDSYSLTGHVNLVESIPIHGHVSTMLLLEGLIAIILSIFFFVFMIWSIRDAFRVAESKRLEKEVLSTKKYFKGVWDNGFEYIVLSPAIFVLGFISIMPIFFGFILAFTSISGNQSMVENFSYVGLKNFFAIFNFSSGLGASFGKAFWNVLLWTIIWAVLSTLTVFFGGFIQALILNSEKVVFRKLWRTILILPWAIPALLSQMVFSVMFSETGFINQLLVDIGAYNLLQNIGVLGKPFAEMTGMLRHFWLGEENIMWFTNPYNTAFVKATLVIVNIWLGFPYFMALMTGIMTAIDKTLYEAADIDGATGFQKIVKITAPLVLYSTAPILIMTFSSNFNNFGVIYFITGGGPNEGIAARGYAGSTDILISWMYSLTVDYSIYNMASVFSVLIFFLVGSVTAWNLSRTRAFQED